MMSDIADIPTRPTWSSELAKNLKVLRDELAAQTPTGVTASAVERATLPKEIPDGIEITSLIVVPFGITLAGKAEEKKIFELPDSISLPKVLDDGRIKADAVPCFTYSVPSSKQLSPAETKVILFFHGGGNVAGHPADLIPGPQFVPLFTNLVRSLDGEIIFAPSYRCATLPEYTFPANLQDAFFAYKYLLIKGYKTENITIAGDSAGGNLAFTTTYLLSQLGEPLPKRLVAFAPAADLSYNLSNFAKAQADVDLFSVERYKELTAQYLHHPDSKFPRNSPTANPDIWRADDPLVSAVYIPKFPDIWPKTLILVGTADILIDSSRTLTKRLKDKGKDIELVEYDDAVHGFWMFSLFFESAHADAWARFKKFIQN